MKSKVGVFSTPQKIDERISALEYDITHNTIDLKQENKVALKLLLLLGMTFSYSLPACNLQCTFTHVACPKEEQVVKA